MVSPKALFDRNFAIPVIEDLERMLEISKHYNGQLSNTVLATL